MLFSDFFFCIFCRLLQRHLSLDPLSPLNLLTPLQPLGTAPRCLSHLAAQRQATPPHPPYSLAARHPHPPNPLRRLVPARPPCPRRRRQEPPPSAGPCHPERLSWAPLSRPLWCLLLTLADGAPSPLHTPMHQLQAMTEGAA
jgi:hypothetical protein